ncbi:ankyrin repeat-containing domain protein [Bisporella sp. PMI_857]|nr:ankyrin repeat-containing domain protein [Bisporella sp. PMI_857]
MLSPVSALPSREEFNGLVSVEIKLTVDRLIKHCLAIIRTTTAGKYSKAALDSCLRSLAYPEMNYRRQDTKRAHENTCGWITCHQSYIDWLREGSGILWIKGKPGSGKSTLMEALLRDYEKQAVYKESIQLSFFFHGRGTALQKSRLGMFRSLLHQLLIKAPGAGAEIQRAFKERSRTQGNSGKDWNWHVNELREFFISAVASVAKVQPVNIFVDALDEADDSTDGQYTSYEIVVDFHKFSSFLDQNQLRSTICFSCRHFPAPRTNQKWEIIVEKENHADISTYVCDELDRSLSANAEKQYIAEWQETIVKEAHGVFQWAALVVGMLVKWHNHGKLVKEIRKLLAEVPKQLSEVYKHILTVIDKEDNQQTLRLMRWVLLAERPLTVEEGRFAMYLPDKEILAPRSSVELELPTINMMVKQIVSLSGGLIECKEHKKSQIIQFIHQSVNDFLSREGLGLLDVTSRENSIGQGHHQLSLICANYMKITEMDNLSDLSINAIKAWLPFMDYAVRSWFLHAEKAETRGVPQDYLLPLIQHCPKVFQHWVMLNKMLDRSNYSARSPDHNSTMLHIASGANLLTVVKGLLSTSAYLEQMDGSGNRALHYASRWGHAKVVKVLLDAGAMVDAQNYSKCTALERAAANGHKEVVLLLLDNKAEVNAQGGEYGNALQAAAYEGHQAIVQLLLENKAEVNAQGGEYGNALQAAAYRDHQAIVRLLLDNKAKIDAQSGRFGNALQAAAYGGHQEIVQLLLDNKAEVNAQGGEYGNAFQAAAYKGNQAILQLLLDNKAKIDAQSGRFGNALQAAAYGGHQEIVLLLLDNKAEVNAQGGVYGNALQAAAYRGDQAIVRLLLHKGASIIRQDNQGRSPIQLAMRGNHDTLINLILTKIGTPNWKYQDQQGCSALHFAASGGSDRTVQVILGSDADIDLPDTCGWTPLHWACRSGNRKTVQMLKDSGADSTRKDIKGWTPLDVAMFCGNGSLGDLLQEETNRAEPKQIVTKPGERQHYFCDSCYHDIYGTRYNCDKCGFFDLCFRCITDADKIHELGHSFKVIDR